MLAFIAKVRKFIKIAIYIEVFVGLISKSNFKSYAANFWFQITLGFINIKEGNK